MLAHTERVGADPLLPCVGEPDEVQQVLDPPGVNAGHPRSDRERRPATAPGMHRRCVTKLAARNRVELAIWPTKRDVSGTRPIR